MDKSNLNNRTKIIILWLLLIVCMILHFDYHISGLVYGLDIRTKDANGSIPGRIVYIRSAFHFLPLLYILLVMWFKGRWIKIGNLVLSVVYSLAHLAHLAEEIKKADNPSQVTLLSITAILSILLIVASFFWNKESGTEEVSELGY